MKFFKKNSTLRDFVFFCLLIAGIGAIVSRKDEPQEISTEKKHEPFSAHEIDPTTLKYIESFEKQIDVAMYFIHTYHRDADMLQQLGSLAQEIELIKKHYTHTSPAVAILGPIGSASVVLKEQELNNKLLKKIRQLNNVLAYISKAEKPHNQAQTIPALLQQNESFIAHLHRAAS